MRTIRFPKRLTDEAKAQSVLYPNTGLEVAAVDEGLQRAQDFVWALALIDSAFGDPTRGVVSK